MALAAHRTAERAARGDDGATAPTIHDVATAAVEGKGAGVPVPEAVRRTAESHLGADLGGVRVHQNDEAQASAAAMGAQAFAYGADVFLGPGQRADDVGLMTHELTHVVQQGAAGAIPQLRVEVAPSDHPAEAEADAVAGRAVTQGQVGRGAIVEDGAPPQAGQLTKSQLLGELQAAAEAEIAAAPPEMAPEMRQEIGQQLAQYRVQDVKTLEHGLAQVSGGPQRDARAYVAGVRAKLREHVAGTAGAAPASGVAVAAQMGPSQPLDGAAAKAAGTALGEPLGNVEVHTGPEAARFASQHDARAVAVGAHIAFGAGEYQPGTPEGDALIAHEVAHTVQMKGADPAGPVGRSDDAAETEADDAAEGILGEQYGVPGAKPHKSLGSVFRRTLSLSRCSPNERQRAEARARALATELQTLIDGAEWKEIRKRAYPRESAAGIARAKARKTGAQPDLTGLGRIAALEHFAAAVHGLQRAWPATPALRVAALATALNAEMVSAGVPPFLVVDKEAMEFKGYFRRRDWAFMISEALVTGGALSDADAGEVCNTALHEARHAEQQFLAARFSAGAAGGNKNARQIATEQRIPEDPIAIAAVAAKFDGATAPAVAGLGQRMFDATVTHGDDNQRISDDDGLAELATKRAEARAALAAMTASPGVATIAAATAKRDALRAQIALVERLYTDYRNIPYEADAHEVGDAAEQAFKGWP